MTDSTGVFLYSRVMTFADCSRMSLPADLLPLCTSVPPGQRPIAQAYIWTPASPLLRLPEPEFSPAVNQLAKRFAVAAIEAQPLDYAAAVWDDTARSFAWNRTVFPNGQTYDGVGLAPDVEVDADKEAVERSLAMPASDPAARVASDVQLRTALALLRP